MVSSGYAPITATQNAHVILEQKGVIESLNAQGFSEERAKQVVAEIMESKEVKPRDRLTATDQVFKVHGTYAPEKRLTATVDINELQETVRSQIAMFRALKGGQH